MDIMMIIIGGSLMDIHSFIHIHSLPHTKFADHWRAMERNGNERRHIAKC